MPEETPVDPNTTHLKDIATTSDHALVQGSKHLEATQNLEVPLEGILLKTAEIAENTKPKDVQKVSIEGAELVTIKGEKGDKPSDEELVALMLPLIPPLIPPPTPAPTSKELTDLILPLIPPAIPGKNADAPTKEALTALIRPLIPVPIPGKDADDPTVEQLTAIIKPLIPKAVPGKPGSPDTGADIVRKHKALPADERISFDDLKDKPNFDTYRGRGVATKDYATNELTDVSMQGIVAGQVLQWDGQKFIPYTPSASGLNQVFGEDLAVQGVGTTFNLAHTPIAGSVRLYRGGSYQQLGVDYTISGATITLTNALVANESLLTDYNF